MRCLDHNQSIDALDVPLYGEGKIGRVGCIVGISNVEIIVFDSLATL
ncbi:MAG: hypothetical protein DF168_00757 [Candidatus Moanabacter tarae]|uniref:Uncharacterized protein n=1 Tax=Candidatus Moanibacter tarae TaxID=2200854 RepID=A0A2Z4AF39_9BACT|nr:MAG: hypothetical protein DF168_00757 [Candidatus Moanabacter tarae]